MKLEMTHTHHIIPKHMGGSNLPSNLIELTIEEHALAHKKLWEDHNKVEDKIAWLALSGMIGKEELARNLSSLGGKIGGKITQLKHPNLSRSIQLKKVESRTHPWLGSTYSSLLQNKRVENGTHHFLGGDISRRVTKQRLADGTHNFLSSEFQRNNQLRRLADGTHNLIGYNKVRINNGTHNCLLTNKCPYCGKTGKGPGLYRWHFDKCKKRGQL